MKILSVEGGRPLDGCIRAQGSKNSVLPIMAASLLAGGETVIRNCPELSDVDVSVRILRHLGCAVRREGDAIAVDPRGMDRSDIPDCLMREMRSSVVFMGAILARTGFARLTYPGGCELGPRPIDLHLSALRELGAEIDETGGRIICRAAKLKCGTVRLATPSVGATENAMLAASRAEGETLIFNPAREPEIADLQDFLRKLGTDVSGAGGPVISVRGGRPDGGADHTVIPDRIVAATWLCAACSAGGRVEVTDCIPEHFESVTEAAEALGAEVERGADSVSVRVRKPLRAIRPVSTAPYPGFPTDAQPPLMAAALKAAGTTVFVENIFENRYGCVEELKRMGADVRVSGRTAIVCGVPSLHGASVRATDLRGGAALAVAALGAEGTSEIQGAAHILRGYERPDEALRSLGAYARLTE
jgi:UDP-N-acetylglucosamine 1-carboxyvinyltransferase